MLALAVVLGVVVAILFFARDRRQRTRGAPVRDTTPALDAFLREALEEELAEGALGLRRSTKEERRRLAQTLAHEPDADVVARIEQSVRAVELEFVRYAHETDVEATVSVRYEDGRTGTAKRRLASGDVPAGVREDFDKKGATRVFRTWTFPWQRAASL
jgi:hypothetical protein